MKRPENVVVVGAGLGGLSAALMLANQGLQVTLLEQAPELGEIGAGIQLSPNATRVLYALGLEKELERVAFRPEGVETRSWRSGRMLSKAPLGERVATRFGFPYLHIHRADLVQALASAANASQRIEVLTGANCSGIEQDASSVTALTASGERYTADLLVGADGIRSTVREEVAGEQSPRFTGTVVWRGMVPASALPPGLIRPVAGLWPGPGAHFVHYYVRSGELVNFVACLDQSGWEVDSWTEPGEKTQLKSDFKGWHETIQQLIDAADPAQCFKWALFDRDPLASWTDRRVTLLGDACHAMLPFMAQGACMAIEDGAVLAHAVTRGHELGASLAQYESLRRPRTTRMQLGSRSQHAVYHMKAPRSWFRDASVLFGRKITPAPQGLFEYNALDAVETNRSG